MNGNNNTQLKLIMQALIAAETSIGLAKQLLASYGGMPVSGGSAVNNFRSQRKPMRDNRPSTRDLPGMIGKYDGENLITEDGKTFPVPTNYAGKSKLVYGDTLKVMESPDGGKLFKQIDKVNRKKLEAKLAKKDGKWVVVTGTGETYKTLGTNVEFLGGKEGDDVAVLIPEDNVKAPYAAVDYIPAREAERRARNQSSAPVSVPIVTTRPVPAVPAAKPAVKEEPKVPVKVEEVKEEKPATKRGGRKPSGRVEKEEEKEEPKAAKKEEKKKEEVKEVKVEAATDDDELR